MGLSWQEYWSGLPFPTPGGFLDLGIKPTSLEAPALTDRLFIVELPGKSHLFLTPTPKHFLNYYSGDGFVVLLAQMY